MAITVVDMADGIGFYSDPTFDVSLPTCQENDIVLVFNSGSTTNESQSLGVTTSGYTKISDLYVEGTDNLDQNMAISWKRMGSTPDTSVTCTALQGSADYYTLAVIYILRGVSTADILDVAIVTATGTAGTSIPNPPAITPVTAGAMIVICGSSISSDWSTTEPTGYSNPWYNNTSGGNTNTLVVASKLWGGSGEENPDPWTGWTEGTHKTWIAATLAIAPPAPPVVTGVPGTLTITGQTPYVPTIGFMSAAGTTPNQLGYGELGGEIRIAGKTPTTTAAADLGFIVDGYSPAVVAECYVEEIVYVSINGKTAASTGSGELGFTANGISPNMQGSSDLVIAEHLSIAGFTPQGQGHLVVDADNVIVIDVVTPPSTGSLVFLSSATDDVIRYRRAYDNG